MENYSDISDFVPKKFYQNLLDEMEYHEYEFVSQEVDEIAIIKFKKGDSLINVMILFHETENKRYLFSKKSDFRSNIMKHLIQDGENILIYDSELSCSALNKHVRDLYDYNIRIRDKKSYIRNIYNVLKDNEYQIVTKDEIELIENMRMLTSFAQVCPAISSDDVICHLLRAKQGDIIKRSFLDTDIKNYSVKYFFVK